MSEPDLQEIHDFLVGLAGEAGSKIVAANPSTVDTKKNSSDLVTETDKAVEDLISSSLKIKYPDYSFLGEETAQSGRLTDAPTFVVDPIDGTTNFVHAHPYISISLAFAHKQKPLVGVVYNPFTQHLYTAIKGQGAFLTAPKIPSSFPAPGQRVESIYERRKLPLRSPPPPLPDLSSALVAVEYGNERHGNNWDCKIGTFSALGRDKSIDGAMVQSIRSLGSAALNMCSVARGDLDVYWEGGCWPWDVAAGWVIVEESGGMVVGGSKGEWSPKVDGRRYLVLRAGAGREVVDEFWSKVKAPTSQAYDATLQSEVDLHIPRDSPTLKALSPRLEQPTDLASLLAQYSDLIPPLPSNLASSYRFILLRNTAFYPSDGYESPANDASQDLDPFYGNIASRAAQNHQQNIPNESALAFGSGRVFANFHGMQRKTLDWQDLEAFALRLQQFVKRGFVGKLEMVMWPPHGGSPVVVNLATFG
ncbi:MAG: hypothetical protein LQ352_004240 [Teloschistes flavicans]|nr:MAG: hypothetical protein LQ352_004240 [Teloschistes flavicans]